MSHRSKREVTRRRCRVCGQGGWEFKGVRYRCPYTALHRLAARRKDTPDG